MYSTSLAYLRDGARAYATMQSLIDLRQACRHKPRAAVGGILPHRLDLQYNGSNTHEPIGGHVVRRATL